MGRDARVKIGLACAGGVVEGAFYEVGVLCALEDSIARLDLNRLDVYVGVSAGAILTACLANGIPAHTISRAMVSQADPLLNLRPEILFTPALGEYAQRLARLPATVAGSLRRYLLRPFDISLFGAVAELGSALPLGFFDNRPIERYLARIFSVAGRTNDFRELRAELRVVAVNLDSSELVSFGDAATAHVPISRAVQASAALPILYTPVQIEGQYYIDGVARRTLHASEALSEGVDLLFCVNPIVPVDMHLLNEDEAEEHFPKSLVEKGLPAVLSQTFRTMIHSRMITAFKNYEHVFPDADVVLIQPELNDHRMFFSNILSFSNRYHITEHAYQSTRRYLAQEATRLRPVLERHGLELRRDALRDPEHLLFPGVTSPPDLVGPALAAAREPDATGTGDALTRLDGALSRLARALEPHPHGNGGPPPIPRAAD